MTGQPIHRQMTSYAPKKEALWQVSNYIKKFTVRQRDKHLHVDRSVYMRGLKATSRGKTHEQHEENSSSIEGKASSYNYKEIHSTVSCSV